MSLTRIRFVKNAGLGSRIITGLFLCKIAAGLLSGRITENVPDADTWGYHISALDEYKLLFTHPKQYFINLFQSGYKGGYDGVLVVRNSYWNDLKTNLLIKLLSILDVFSRGNYYVNVVLYNFLTFFGSIGLYRIFKDAYKNTSKLVLLTVFLLPSLLFYSSTIHKDGIIFAATGALFFNTCHALYFTGFTARRIIFILLSLLVLFIMRSFVFIALLPALTALIITVKKKYNAVVCFCIIYTVAAILFFSVGHLTPALDLPVYVVQRQADFLKLGLAHTFIAVNGLYPDFISFAINAPQALLHSLFRPYLTDTALSIFLLPLAIELAGYEIAVIIFIFFRRKPIVINHPVIICGLFFALSMCLMIGYTVPVIGAIVRYRSIYLPFLVMPVLLNTDWKKILKILQFKK